MYPLQFLVLFVLLPLTVYSQVPTFRVDGVQDNVTGNIAYLIKLKLALSPANSDLTESSYVLDTNANSITHASNCTEKAQLWAFFSGDGGPTASANDALVGSLTLTCAGKQNIAGFSSKRTSLPAQVSHAAKLPLRFGYSLFPSGGTLFIGKTQWVQFISIVPEVKKEIRFVEIPMKVDDPSSGYLVKLTGAVGKTEVSVNGDYVEVSTTQRFTTLPRTVYSFILGEFQREAEEMKINPVGTGYGKLNLCCKMRNADVKKFGNVTMVFSSKFRWSVPAEKYLVPKPNSANVFCFGYLEAAPGGRGIIGTLQQEERAIEYHLEKKLLRVSLPLSGSLFSP